ncbi:excalibur calcium-binding domain-containing protein [Streptococcus ruminantium]|nr:excalibur calcium-binding domain-containing protein [Streptococcus ruminantium]
MFTGKITQKVTSVLLKKSRKFFNRKTGIIAGVTLAIIFITGQLTTAELPKKEKLYGQQYATVVKHFQEAGFENIQGKEINDLEFGKIGENNPVEVVSVDGEKWKEGWVRKNAPIVISYHAPKEDTVEVKFSPSSKIADIEKELSKLGFKQIDMIPILLIEKGNEDKKDRVDTLQIGNHLYQTGYFYSASLPVKLTYFDVSQDNIRVPENVIDAESKSELEKHIKVAGFTDIKWEAVADKDKSNHEKIQKITLGGVELRLRTKQEIVIKKETPIVIAYSDFSSFAELPTTISTTTIADTKKLFIDGGFPQVTEVATDTNEISKNGQVIAVEIDGKVFSDINDKVIKKDSQVVIKYWNAEKAIAEKALKDEEARIVAEAKRQTKVRAQNQIQQFAGNTSQNVYYPNCKAARQAGAAPVYRGQPGYGPHLDRDGDGIGCER